MAPRSIVWLSAGLFWVTCIMASLNIFEIISLICFGKTARIDRQEVVAGQP